MRRRDERLDRAENELRFRWWLHRRRLFEAMNVDELEAYASTGHWVDRPEPSFGSSRLDFMDKACLIKLWQQDKKGFAGRGADELEFYAIHGRWP